MKAVLIAGWLTLRALAGNEVGGLGLAEKNLAFAYANLKSYVEQCLATPVCKLDVDEYRLLRAIRDTFAKELPTERALVFKSEKKEPGFFVIDGQVKAAKTEYAVGAPVYVNLDQLYYSSARIPLSVAEGVALLVHELGHHHGEKDHLKLDVLGAKVQTFFAANRNDLKAGRYAPNVQVSVVDFDAPGVTSQVLASDTDSLYDLTPMVLKESHCGNGPTKGFFFQNLHWARTFPLWKGRPALLLRGLLRCNTVDSAKYFYLTLPTEWVDGKVRFAPKEFGAAYFPATGGEEFFL